MMPVSPALTPPTPAQSLAILLRALKLPSFARHSEEIAQKAEREGWMSTTRKMEGECPLADQVL